MHSTFSSFSTSVFLSSFHSRLFLSLRVEQFNQKRFRHGVDCSRRVDECSNGGLGFAARQFHLPALQPEHIHNLPTCRICKQKHTSSKTTPASSNGAPPTADLIRTETLQRISWRRNEEATERSVSSAVRLEEFRPMYT